MTDEKIKPVAWYDGQHKDFSHVERIGWKPLYPEFALAQAEERGRIAGLRDAAKLLDDNWYKTQADCIEAITRAAEGKRTTSHMLKLSETVDTRLPLMNRLILGINWRKL
jgi:hypothetical protein